MLVQLDLILVSTVEDTGFGIHAAQPTEQSQSHGESVHCPSPG